MNHMIAGRLRPILCTALGGLLLAVATSHAAPPADLDRHVQQVREAFQVPGMVIVIAERGQPTLVRSFGIRRMGEAAPVDDRTLFAIGSTTKAFTTALLAMLVDEGKLGWDTKVADVLPDFRLYDAFASNEMTVRDLLVHRSGLSPGAGDLLFYPPSDRSRAEIVHQLRYIKPVTGFRSGFAYDNLLYIAAGQVVEQLTGKRWEDVLRQRILAPLQMNQTSPSSILPEDANRAWPHGRYTTGLRGEGPIGPLARPLPLDNAAPAGAINASGADIARWLELQLGRGVDPRTGQRFWSEAQAREMWLPQTLMPIPPNPKPLELAQANLRAYALAWIVSDYRGHLVVAHGGGVPGMVTLFVIVPGRDVAFAILSNAEESGALAAMQYWLLDHYLGLSGPDWPAALLEVQHARVAAAREQLDQASKDSSGAAGKGPSLPLASYAGRYRDDWYGRATVEHTPAGLRISFEHTPALSGPLEHVRYDTFRTRWPDRTVEDAYVTFALNPDGSVERMSLRAISPLADFSFDYQDLQFRPEH